ncbi:MAG: hypothetical protein F4137_12270 [Acidobacteria bacterium]|nr:hypothetical protein [Acidobacteriota bacterium]
MARSSSAVRGSGGGVLRVIRRRRPRRVRFREWARRVAGRLAAVLVLWAAAPLLVVPLAAQGPPTGNRIMTCIENRPETAAFDPGGDLGPDGPARDGGMIPPTSMIRAAVVCAEEFANTTMVPIGVRLFRSLAVIIVIWTGIQMMFSGSFAIGEVVSLVLLLGFPWAVLSFYAATVLTPWGNVSFTRMVSGMGENIAENLVDGVFIAVNDTVRDVWNRIWSAQVVVDAANGSRSGSFASRAWDGMWEFDLGLGDHVEGLRDMFRSFQLVLLVGLVGLLLLVPMVVAYCSYLWAYLSLMVAIILGPVLIPWVIVPQMQFLAWGWFRAVLGAGIHMMVAGACFAVAAQIMLIPLVRFGAQVSNTDNAGLLSVATFLSLTATGPLSVIVESLPLIVVAYLGVFKIGEITAMIMNGGSMPASGIGDRMNSMGRLRGMAGSGRALLAGGGGGAAAAGGAARAALAATGVGAAVVAAGAVLSQSTKRS